MVKALVLTGYGINCNEETKYAFERAGALTEQMHITELIENKKKLETYHLLAFPGGFSYGDDTGSGKALANRLRNTMWEELLQFIAVGKLIIGICNGFQVMTNLGLLPAITGEYGARTVALTHNTSARYECRWVELIGSSKCIFTQGIDKIELPIAHGEGRFYASDNTVNELTKRDMIALRYAKNGFSAKGEFPYNPNGSLDDIAGICDESGRIFGLMPHPERFIDTYQHPLWTKNLPKEGAGLQIFTNAVRYFI